MKPVITQDNRQVNVLLASEQIGVFAAILQILAPFHEARAAVAEALAGMKKVEPIKDRQE